MPRAAAGGDIDTARAIVGGITAARLNTTTIPAACPICAVMYPPRLAAPQPHRPRARHQRDILWTILTRMDSFLGTHRSSAGIYGKDEFYGRRFFYKTTTGQMLVVTVPRIPSGQPYESGPAGANPCEQLESYPTLRATLEALDRFQTRLYPNAVIPLALAHSAASLPLGTGRDVLTLLAQRGLQLDRDSVGFGRTPSY